MTAYDTKSIMHYDGLLGGRVDHPIMTDKLTGKGIEVNKNMSSLDIEKLNEMYPCNRTDPVCGKFIRLLNCLINLFSLIKTQL